MRVLALIVLQSLNVLETRQNGFVDFTHHDYEQMTSILNDLHAAYPSITRLFSLGKSTDNRELWVLQISDKPEIHEPGEPEFKYIGNMHGNEVVSREILLHFIEHLLQGYNKDDEITNLIKDKTKAEVSPSQLILKEDLNKIGLFKADINFHSDVRAQISIKIDKIQSK